MSSHCLLSCTVSNEKLMLILTFASVYVMYLSLSSFQIYFLSLVFSNLVMLRLGIIFFVFLLHEFHQIIWIWVLIFSHYIWWIFGHNFCKYSYLLPLFSSTPDYLCGRMLNSIQQVAEACLFPLHLPFLSVLQFTLSLFLHLFNFII